jgi:hypothetical protein
MPPFPWSGVGNSFVICLLQTKSAILSEWIGILAGKNRRFAEQFRIIASKQKI